MQEIKQTAACSTPLHVERTVYEAGLRLCASTAAVGMASRWSIRSAPRERSSIPGIHRCDPN